MSCPLERPVCKRSIMTSNKPFEKKECPLNIKPKCALSPPPCPVLPQEETKCGYAKLMGEGISVSECPCKSCFFTTGCPISINPCVSTSQGDVNSNIESQWPDKVPPCTMCTDGKKEPSEKLSLRLNVENKQISTPKNIQSITNRSFASSPRPLPCSECILQEFADEGKDGKKAKSCPYLFLPDTCGKKCYCPDVPNIESGPLCPFSPKPCPCCTTPRCPLSRKPDCILQPKPPCCLCTSKCSCGASCPTKYLCPGPSSCFCSPCLICLSPCKNSCSCCVGLPLVSPIGDCSLKPCFCDKCSLPCQEPGITDLLCACSPPACPLVNSCSPCQSFTCPLIQPGCSSPSCMPCLLKTVECVLNPCACSCKSISPPVPPPCSLTKTFDYSNSERNGKEADDRTFHLPTCPVYEPPCGIHSLFDQKKAVCPFSPNPCPISSRCPFPVSITLPEKNIYSKEQRTSVKKVNANGDSPTISKSVRFSIQKVVINETDTSHSSSEDIISNSKCPYSPSCGIVPLPACPAARFLCPETYKKPKKVKNKPCPLKKCMNKPSCPLSAVKPKINCPLGDFPDCPLAEEPECPLEEFFERCVICCQYPCICSCTLPTCCVKPFECSPCPQSACPCTSTDGSPCSNKITDLTHNNSSNSVSIDTCPSSYTSFTLSSNKYSISKSITNKSDESFPLSNAVNISISSINTESPTFDGCCSAYRKPCDRIMHPSINSSSTSECPYESLAPKTVCPLAPPKCPLTPKPSSCPLTRKPDPCPLTMGGVTCPVKFPPCKKFPEGRCPMGDINACDCDYPVSPCLLPIQNPDVVAPPQYCLREDCCMGLPIPPSVPKNTQGKVDEGPFYQYKDTKPGKEETKHYIQILNQPPSGEVSLFGKPKKRIHDNWTVVKHGEGYLRCKTVAEKLKDIGSINMRASQYDAADCPLDEETRIILENRKNHLKDERDIERLKLSLGLKEKKQKKSNK